jgi:hypothetical protein
VERNESLAALFTSGVVNVEDFYGVARDPIKDLIRISDQRCDANPGPLDDFLCALWPSGDPRNDRMKSILERLGDSRVVVGNVVEDTIQISKRLGGIGYLHSERNFWKTLLT